MQAKPFTSLKERCYYSKQERYDELSAYSSQKVHHEPTSVDCAKHKEIVWLQSLYQYVVCSCGGSSVISFVCVHNVFLLNLSAVSVCMWFVPSSFHYWFMSCRAVRFARDSHMYVYPPTFWFVDIKDRTVYIFFIF